MVAQIRAGSLSPVALMEETLDRIVGALGTEERAVAAIVLDDEDAHHQSGGLDQPRLWASSARRS